MINSIMILKLSQVDIHYVVKEYLYSVSNIVFYSIEIGNIVFVADVISKEVCKIVDITFSYTNWAFDLLISVPEIATNRIEVSEYEF